jgi:hypothetical protein
LIKKLKNAVGNENAKNRRETVAVSKFSSDEEPEKEEPSKGRKPKTPNRRATVAVTEKPSGNGAAVNGRSATPVKSSRASASRSTPAKQEAKNLQEESDEDIVEVPVKRRSSSRTATPTLSLGKSDTVRTSYKSMDDEKVEEVQEIEDDSPPPFTQRQQPQPAANTSLRRKTFTTSGASGTPKFSFSEKSSFSIPSISTSSYRKQAATQPEDEEVDEISTPYLSNFAKRLSTLRAEPLADSGMDKYKGLRDSGATSYQQSAYSYKTQGAPAKSNRGLVKSVGSAFDSLDRQYNFRNVLYFIFFVMIVVAIYVLFFM